MCVYIEINTCIYIYTCVFIYIKEVVCKESIFLNAVFKCKCVCRLVLYT